MTITVPRWVIGGLVAVLVVAGLALGAVALFGGSDEDDIRSTAERFLAAMADGDGESACDELALEEQETLAAAARTGSQCQHGANTLSSDVEADFDSLTIDRVDIEGDTAVVGFDETSLTFGLDRVDGDWKISDLAR